MGLESHLSDSYLNWRVTLPEMVELRNLIDSIPTEYHNTVYKIMDIAKQHEEYNNWDNEAGEAL